MLRKKKKNNWLCQVGLNSVCHKAGEDETVSVRGVRRFVKPKGKRDRVTQEEESGNVTGGGVRITLLKEVSVCVVE